MFAILSQLDIYTVSQGGCMDDDVSDLDDYVPIHTTRTCSCRIVTVDCGKLGSLAARGRTICIALDDDNRDSPLRILELDLSKPKSDSQYVAISHVRAEGLGNSRASSLPQCQIRRIQAAADALSGAPAGSTFFWIDSLCVPADRRTKKLAARQICQVFTLAIGVLVLVPSIMSSEGGSPKDRLATVASSPWPKRLWTLQEGAVAKRLFFQFKDKAVALDQLLGGTSAATERSKPSDLLLDEILQFSDDIKIDSFPSPFKYKTNTLSRHRAKTRLRSYLRLCFLMLPIFQHFATEDEQARLPSMELVMNEVYANKANSIHSDNASMRDLQISRLRRVMELEETAG